MAITKAGRALLFALWLFGEILPQNQGSPTVSRPLATCARRTQRDFGRKTRLITRHRKAKPPHRAPQARPALRHCGRRTPKTRQHLMVSPQTRKPVRFYRRQCMNTPFGPDPSPSPAQQKGPSREAGAKEREAMGREPAGKAGSQEREANPRRSLSRDGPRPGSRGPRRGRQRDGSLLVRAGSQEREAKGRGSRGSREPQGEGGKSGAPVLSGTAPGRETREPRRGRRWDGSPPGKRAPKEREANPRWLRSLGTAPGREAGSLGEGGEPMSQEIVLFVSSF